MITSENDQREMKVAGWKRWKMWWTKGFMVLCEVGSIRLFHNKAWLPRDRPIRK